jgi:hypothetical protein
MLELLDQLPIFVGFKLDSSLRRQLDSLPAPEKKYVSGEDSDFLRLCRRGEDLYVGKLIHERLTTDRVDDVRRNVLSIMSRLCPEVRLPAKLEIMACGAPSPVGPVE